SQSLVMTPQLMQSIRLLQLNHLELERFINEEIERNPLLERAEAVADGDAGPVAPEAAYSAEAISERLDSSLENLFPDDPGRRDSLPPDLAAQWRSSPSGSQNAAADYPDIESLTAARVTLFD